MTPKPGNAFAQQNLQRPKDLEIQPLEEDSLSTPMTTMSMFIGPESSQVDYKEPSELKIRSSGDPSLKASTGKGKFGKRAFTEPLGAATAYSASISEQPSHSKPSGGLSYRKFKFNGRNKKNKPSGSLSQPLMPPAPSQFPSHTPDLATMPYMHTKEATPEDAHKTCQKLPSRFVPSSISTTTTQSIATRQSQYASALRNDAMVLGNILMSPTRSGSYTVGGYPAIVGVSHPSIVSMSGSIFDGSPPPVGTTSNNHMYLDPPAHPETYDASYIAPLPPPPGEELMEQNSFHQQLPFYLKLPSQQQTQQTKFRDQPLFHYQHDICNSGAWEQMHVQHPGTMPRFSPVTPKRSYQDVSKRDAMLAEAFENSPETVDQRNAGIESLLYNQNASDTKSESGIEVYRVAEDSDDTTVNFTTTLRNSVRKSVSNYELRYTSHRSDPPTRKPVSQKDGNSSAEPAKASNELSPTAPIFRPAGHETFLKMTPIALKPDRYEVGGPEQLQLAQDLLQDLQGTVSLSQDASDPSSAKRPGHISEAKRRESASTQNPRYFNPCGGYPPSTQHAHYQAQNNLAMQMGHQFNYVHHHLDADMQSLRDCIEDAKSYLAGNSSCRADEKFMNQFRQMCIQNNGFRQYLERIEQQTSNLRPGIATDVLPGVSVEMASQFAAHESHYQKEFGQMNRNLLTLRENFYGFQRNMNKQVSQISQKMDLLLEAQGKIISSAGEFANQDRNLKEQKPLGGLCRRKDEVADIAAMAEKEENVAATVATISAASSPASQVSTPITMRNPTPLATKLPIMAAALTSTPPHVPQLPPSQSQSSSFAKVTITDPGIPSPSAVSNARRIRKGDMVEQGDAGKEYRQAGILAEGLANTTAIHNHGSHIHPALRYKEDTNRLAEGQEKHQVAERAHGDKSKVLWRRPSDNGEIGGRWYKAAMEQ